MDPPFPSSPESIAASALLLLSANEPPPRHQFACCVVGAGKRPLTGDRHKSIDDAKESLFSGDSKLSSSTSVITDECSSEEIERRRIKSSGSALVARYRELRLKVSQRNRSKRSSTAGGMSSLESAQEAVSETSCVSICSEPGHEEVTTRKITAVRSGHLLRRAEAIMRFLESGGCASEVCIRQVLGDSPDTSKALRILLKLKEVKRSGVGGRSDPYIYKAMNPIVQVQ